MQCSSHEILQDDGAVARVAETLEFLQAILLAAEKFTGV